MRKKKAPKSATKVRLAVPPGATIKEFLEDNDISEDQFADLISMPVAQVQALIRGKIPLSRETARKLENLTGVGATFWERLEEYYSHKLKQ